MVASFTDVTMSLTVWVQFVYTLHCTSQMICSTHTLFNILHTVTPILPGTDATTETQCNAQDSGHHTCDITNVMYLKGIFTTGARTWCYLIVPALTLLISVERIVMKFWCLHVPLPQLGGGVHGALGHGCWDIQLHKSQAPHINKSWNFLDISTFLLIKKFMMSAYACVFTKINCTVISAFFITQFSNSLKQFCNYGIWFERKFICVV
jgi:hypothetical protein